jgi:hypothetical protein
VPKPSIFSKDYEKKMRRRRKIITFAVVISIVLVIYTAASMQGIFRNLNKEINQVKNVTTDKGKEIKKQSETPAKKVEKSEGYSIKLSSGKSVNAIYEVKNGNKVFKELSPAENNAAYSISPLGKNMVIYDNKVQGITLVDINGNKQDISNTQYTASSGTVITREAQIASDPNYIWCYSPKFIDENNIAYISQLPWIGKSTKYIWIETITNKSNTLVQGIQGEDVKLDKLTGKGLTIISDGKTVFLTSNGNVSE